MINYFENLGILAKVPILIAITYLFPKYGTMDRTDMPVTVDLSFYLWQICLILFAFAEHHFIYKLQQRKDGDYYGIVVTGYIITFALLIINLSRFQ